MPTFYGFFEVFVLLLQAHDENDGKNETSDDMDGMSVAMGFDNACTDAPTTT